MGSEKKKFLNLKIDQPLIFQVEKVQKQKSFAIFCENFKITRIQCGVYY